MRSQLTTRWRCTTSGPVNNGRLKSCGFEFVFNDGFTPHCPQCGARMRIISEGLSVSEMLRRGAQLERENKTTS